MPSSSSLPASGRAKAAEQGRYIELERSDTNLIDNGGVMSEQEQPFDDIEKIYSTIAYSLMAKGMNKEAKLFALAERNLVVSGHDNWNGGTTVWEIELKVPYPHFIALEEEEKKIFLEFLNKVIEPFVPEYGHWVTCTLLPKEFHNENWLEEISKLPDEEDSIERINSIFQVGAVIDGRYQVDGLCSASGGMGTILFVSPTTKSYPFQIVLKYCKEVDHNARERFKRETRYLMEYQGNSKIVNIVDANLDFDHPYFVMKYYEDGDLTTIQSQLQADIEYQESIFNGMIDSLQELHSRGYQHRDIKPENFLLEESTVLVSDLGLAKEIGAGTTFTLSREAFGTDGYAPPEYYQQDGHFKHSTNASDIFMLGKTFYTLLSGNDPRYLTPGNIPSSLYRIIQRCCDNEVEKRYQELTLLKQDLKLSYDVLLNRVDGTGKVIQKLTDIENNLKTSNQFDEEIVRSFVSELLILDREDQHRIFFDLSPEVFLILSQGNFEDILPQFLESYSDFVKAGNYGWSYAEKVAEAMRVVFRNTKSIDMQSTALEIAITSADLMNRFAAMDTCNDLIKEISDKALGEKVASLLLQMKGTFVFNTIEPSECNNSTIIAVLKSVKQR